MDASALVGAAASAATTTATTTAQTATQGLGGISGTDFMNILLKQLQYQDPFNPMTNQEMAQQIATIRELEVNTQLGQQLGQVTNQQQVGSAAALIGKHVKGSVKDAQGNAYPLTGIVTGVRFTSDGKVVLELDSGENLPMESLEEVGTVTGTT